MMYSYVKSPCKYAIKVSLKTPRDGWYPLVTVGQSLDPIHSNPPPTWNCANSRLCAISQNGTNFLLRLILCKIFNRRRKNIGEARQLFLSYIFWQMICLIFESLCPILPASYSEKKINVKVSMRGVNCIWNFLFAIIGFRFPSDLDKPWFLLPSSSWKKKTFFQTLIRQVAGRGRTHWECRCARQRPIGHLSYLKTTTGINRTFEILQNSMPHVQLLLASRLAEDEERQLRAAIERVIRIFKSRLFQVRN